MPRALRIALVSVAAVLVLAAPAGVLAAHTANLTVTAVDKIDSNTIRVSGTIDCTRGSFVGWWSVRASAEQNGGRYGESLPTGEQCIDNYTVNWSVDVVSVGGFHGGWVDLTVTGTVQVINFDEQHASTETLTLHVKPT